MDDDYTVEVSGHLVRTGLWRIDARLRFREGLAPEPGDELLGVARLALLRGIMREAAAGRAHGATSVRVRLDTPDGVRETGLGDLAVSGELPH